jgi:hypothetical protein
VVLWIASLRSQLTICWTIPDNATSQPFRGRGTVSFSPILHDELKGRAAAAG